MLRMAKKTISERIGMGKSKKKETDMEDHYEWVQVHNPLDEDR